MGQTFYLPLPSPGCQRKWNLGEGTFCEGAYLGCWWGQSQKPSCPKSWICFPPGWGAIPSTHVEDRRDGSEDGESFSLTHSRWEAECLGQSRLRVFLFLSFFF